MTYEEAKRYMDQAYEAHGEVDGLSNTLEYREGKVRLYLNKTLSTFPIVYVWSPELLNEVHIRIMPQTQFGKFINDLARATAIVGE